MKVQFQNNHLNAAIIYLEVLYSVMHVLLTT